MDENRDMLSDPQKGVQHARGVLAYLFRKILMDIDLDMWRWQRLMNKFLEDPRNGIPPNGKDRSSARGNLNKELHRPRMTWKVFEKAMRFLGPVELRFEVHLKWEGGKRTKHGVNIALRPEDNYDPSDAPIPMEDEENDRED